MTVNENKSSFPNKGNARKAFGWTAKLPLNRFTTELDVLPRNEFKVHLPKKLNALRYFHEYIRLGELYMCICSSGMHNEGYLSLLERPATIGFHTKAPSYFSIAFPSFSHTHITSHTLYIKLIHNLNHFSVECFCWKLSGSDSLYRLIYSVINNEIHLCGGTLVLLHFYVKMHDKWSIFEQIEEAVLRFFFKR